MSWSFFTLLTISAYTANLTTFLVVKNSPTATLQSMEDAVAQGAPICVFGPSVETVRLTRQLYPGMKLVEKQTMTGVIEAVMGGECAGGISTTATWSVDVGRKQMNPKCDLDFVGRPYTKIGGSFATKADAYDKCTSMMSDVVAAFLNDMYMDGWLDNAWRELLHRTHDQSCTSTEAGDDPGHEASSVKAMSGIFFFHGVCVAVLVSIYVAAKQIKKILLVIKVLGRGKDDVEDPASASDENLPDKSFDALLEELRDKYAKITRGVA